MSLDVYLYVDINTGGENPHRVELFEANITHNLNTMADAAGCYEALWRPEKVGITSAEQLIPILEDSYRRLRENPQEFEKYNADNGWGTYEGLCRFMKNYLDACRKHPRALVRADR